MAFTQSSFGPISSHGNSDMPNIWTYRTGDTTAEVLAVDYFADKRFSLADGDFIQLQTSTENLTGFFSLAGGLHIERLEFNPETDMVLERSLEAASVASAQNPAGLGIANLVQIEFGPTMNGPTDDVQITSAGLATFNTGGLYKVSAILEVGREGGAGTSQLFFRFLVDGIQFGQSLTSKLSSANDLGYIDINRWFNIPDGTELVVQMMRDNSGNNSGGLRQSTPTDEGPGTWNVSSSAILRIEKLVPA